MFLSKLDKLLEGLIGYKELYYDEGKKISQKFSPVKLWFTLCPIVRDFDFFVPRHFLVTAATTLMSPYSVDKEFHILVDAEQRIYVNQPSFKLEVEKNYNDSSRQGF